MGSHRKTIESRLDRFRMVVSDNKTNGDIDPYVKHHLLDLAATLKYMIQEIAEIEGGE